MERMQAKARARFAFSEFLGRNGKRCTSERMRILDIIMEQRTPFSADDLLEKCSEEPGLKVCRATMFNTLPLLVSAGFLRRMTHSNVVTYETVRSASQNKPRQIMICNECGKVHRSEARGLSEWVENSPMRGFFPDSASAMVYIYGLCSRCRRSMTKNERFTKSNIQSQSK